MISGCRVNSAKLLCAIPFSRAYAVNLGLVEGEQRGQVFLAVAVHHHLADIWIGFEMGANMPKSVKSAEGISLVPALNNDSGITRFYGAKLPQILVQ